MRTLIVEDDSSSRLLLQKLLDKYGSTSVAVNGKEAIEAHKESLDSDMPYDLICLDIMMPGMDGQETLKIIRKHEEEKGIYSTDGTKIVMVTALSDMSNIMKAYMSLCDGYITKPVCKSKLVSELQKLKLLEKE